MAEKGLLFAKGETEVRILPEMANRHGLIAGATGTGKTVSLKVLAESFSSIGVPVFLADIKGDLSGICKPGENSPKIEERANTVGIDNFEYRGFPVVFWDVFGQQGHPVRATISDMGPLLLSKLLNLNETQRGILNIVFRIADDMGMLLIDLKDLKAMLKFVGDNSKDFTTEYGTISKQSIGAIQRELLALEEQGADQFFGEPALDIFDFMKTDRNGMGYINVLAADKLFVYPALYSTFLLWLLAELFEGLPEAGDLEKPKMIFFFDEAHLLFKDAPKVLLQKIEQVVRLIRSKGVGVYFVTQSPTDIPDEVLGQLGNRIQHALRTFTQRDQNVVKAAAETFRANPKINTVQAITELGVGEALISFLDEEGRPSVVERAYVAPPRSYIGPISQAEREAVIRGSAFYGKYEEMYDRESAYEKLKERANHQAALERGQVEQRRRYEEDTYSQRKQSRIDNAKTTQKRRTTDTPLERLAKSAMSSVGREVGRELIRGILGSLLRR
ncbi:MAG TPA: DUF853 domain-containing protein [Clostridiaceae bacterium]|nr:DUF853 domain-containing protein [Clostridiaceae bacterium]